jgi:hypothetical protein
MLLALSEIIIQNMGRNLGGSSTVEGLKEWSPKTVYKHLHSHMPYFVSLLEAFIIDGKSSDSEKKQEDVPIVSAVPVELLL